MPKKTNGQENEASRNHRRKPNDSSDKPVDVVHNGPRSWKANEKRKKERVKKNQKPYSPSGRYFPELAGISKKIGEEMLDGDVNEVRATREQALAIREDAEAELHSIDDAIVQPMLAEPQARATQYDKPENVQQAFANANGFLIAENGFIDEQKKLRNQYLNPRMLSAPIVRRDALTILFSVRRSVDVYGVDVDAKSLIDAYGEVPPIGRPDELKHIRILLPTEDKDIEGDLAQLHVYLLTHLDADKKPDAISLAQAYIKYRRALVQLRRRT